jgi:hypothetical protein
MRPNADNRRVRQPDIARASGLSRYLAVWLFGFALAVGCESTPRIGDSSKPPAQSTAPTYQELAKAHNHRIAQLQKVYADGVIEIRWHDEKGSHFEQGNMELWIQLPRNTALRVEKLGEVLLWLGSNQDHYWLFDMIADEKLLHVGRHDQTMTDQSGGALNVKPLSLLDLMGLTLLPVDLESTPPVGFDQSLQAWVIQTQGQGGPMRIYFDRASLLPSQVETLSTNGEIVLSSVLKRYESVTLEGMLPVAFPKIPELVDIAGDPSAAANRSGGQPTVKGEVKIAINQATGKVDADELARVFDLQRLIKGLNPRRIDGSLPDLVESAANGR